MNIKSAIDHCNGFRLFSAPLNTWSSDEVLTYYLKRKTVQYFPVVDSTQVGRAKIDDILTNCFAFNEEKYQLPVDFDWQSNPSSDLEWLILLHKFYYAVGLGIAYTATGDLRYVNKWMQLTSAWINSVPVDFLSSDVTGRRIQNWIFAHYYFVTLKPTGFVNADFYNQFLTSLHEQVNYLCENLTPARNHRTLELYAIFLAAVVFPELEGADKWLTFATEELNKNMQTDLLPDGVHCELSTDYHHIVLRNFLGVRRLALMNDIYLPAEIDANIKKALQFSLYIHKPDGSIPALSDGDSTNFLYLLQQGYELYNCEEMLYAATKGKQGRVPQARCKGFAASGYYIQRSGWGQGREAYIDERYLVFDCGPLGAGNHGHFDLLSFEMAAYGQSLVIDPGRYTYDESGEYNWRVKFRSTCYHNTVQVDAKNQTRYELHKNKFKIKGAAPDFQLKAFVSRAECDYLHGVAHSHEYPVVHERKVLFINGEYWVICDVLRATEIHDYKLLFHLSPAAQNQVSASSDQHCIRLDSPHLILTQPLDSACSLAVGQGYVSPTYGVKQAAPIVSFSRQAADYCFITVLYPYKQERPKLAASLIAITCDGGPCAATQAIGLSISLTRKNVSSHDLVFFSHEAGKEFSIGQLNTKEPFMWHRRDASGDTLMNSENYGY